MSAWKVRTRWGTYLVLWNIDNSKHPHVRARQSVDDTRMQPIIDYFIYMWNSGPPKPRPKTTLSTTRNTAGNHRCRSASTSTSASLYINPKILAYKANISFCIKRKLYKSLTAWLCKRKYSSNCIWTIGDNAASY